MPTYIVLGSFTEQGLRNITDSPKRAAAVSDMAKKAGASLKDTYWTLGQYDFVAIFEAPDDVTMSALLYSLASASVADLRPPIGTDRPRELRTGVARALVLTPLGLAAARRGLGDVALWAAANETAARLLWKLTAPWPWTPRPVVRGPRRARQEARRRGATRTLT